MCSEASRMYRTWVLAAISAVSVSMIVTFFPPEPLVIYNASGSAPLGFYRIEQRLPKRGEMAAIRPSQALATLLQVHDVLPPGVSLLKRIAGVAGDEVCRSDQPSGAVSINGEVVAETFEADWQDRPLPRWSGCLRLREGEYFLLTSHPRSFDSRYFGAVFRCDVVGVAKAIWTWNQVL